MSSSPETNPKREAEKGMPKFLIVKERNNLARQIEKKVKLDSKKELAKLGTEVEGNKIDPKEVLKEAVVRNFTDNKEADKLLGQTSYAEAEKLMAEIEDRFGAQLAHFAGEEPPIV